jgi:hypothetical protein
MNLTKRTELRRIPDRGSHDWETIHQISSKMRSGPPLEDESDYGVRVWAGILPLEIKPQPPVPDDRLIKGITLPDFARHYEARLMDGASQASNGERRQEIRSCGGV